jgi:DNA-directed RNA polymerase subunit RPC12/RpoP
MADTSVSVKCPNCTAPLTYEPGQEDIVCEYCGSHFSIADIEAYYAKKEEKAAEAEKKRDAKLDEQAAGQQWSKEEQAMLKAFHCSSCGAEIVCDENTIATECCYCGNTTLIPSRYEGDLRPDYVIPFEKDKEAAKAAFKSFYRHKRLLPDGFSGDTRVEAIQGMYVPFWLFDSKVSATGTYRADRVHVFRTSSERITRIDHYECQRAGTMSFSKVPVDGSKRMQDEWMESTGPYDYSDLKPFTAAYLAGYLADKYDVTAKEAVPRADELMETAANEELGTTVSGYTSFRQTDGSISQKRGKISYVLAPIWILTTRYKNKPYTFIMNGQSGKFIGRLPISEKKCNLYTLGAFIVSLPVFYFLVKYLAVNLL